MRGEGRVENNRPSNEVFGLRVLRSFAGQFFVYLLLVEAHDPTAADLDHRHAPLPRLAHDVPRSIRVAF
jgi:hypothetical protein